MQYAQFQGRGTQSWALPTTVLQVARQHALTASVVCVAPSAAVGSGLTYSMAVGPPISIAPDCATVMAVVDAHLKRTRPEQISLTSENETTPT